MVKSYSCMYRNGHCTVWNEQMVLQNHIQWSYCYRIGKLLLKRSQLSSQPDIGVTKYVKISRADWSTCWFNNRLISHIRRALTRQGTIELAREHLPITRTQNKISARFADNKRLLGPFRDNSSWFSTTWSHNRLWYYGPRIWDFVKFHFMGTYAVLI